MNTTKLIKTLALTMLMPAVLLTTSCSKGDDAVTNPEKPATAEAAETAVNKGYALPVTVNVTRQGDGTRATYNESTKKLEFSAGDKLFVSGQLVSIGSGSAPGSFAGTLDYVSEGTFSGTIYTQYQYEGTLDDLMDAASAILLPAGYESIGYLTVNPDAQHAYDDDVSVDYTKAFAGSKTAGIEQLSYEHTFVYSSGFALNPTNAILNFTITDLAASTNVTATLTDGNELTIQGDVTTDAEGNATFAMGVRNGNDLSELSLTVAGNPVTITSSSKELTAGKIYNITRSAGGTVNLSTIYTNYTVSDGKILTGTLASNVKISIADGATVTLNNVTINGVDDGDNYQWAGISCEGDATIILSGTNSVKGFHENYPGIHVPTGKTLTIQGDGSLNASSNGKGSGIGGGWTIPCGNIVIEDGTITATGEFRCAGIGGGTNACGNITISGGTITSQGGDCGAGIGSGQGCACGNITISGGTITAQGGRYGAGIGSGYDNSSCGTVTITSGVTRVTATKGMDAPCSIGKGADTESTTSSCGTVTIGGNVGAITTSPYTYQP